MKKVTLLSSLFVFSFLVSCGGKEEQKQEESPKTTETVEPIVDNSKVELGEEIFEGKGTCVACHKPNVKVVGPSLHDIATIYKEKNASIVTFLKGEGEAIVDPTQFEVMKANFVITKTMSDEELQALEAYINSFL
jgi:cytochrome c